MVMLAEYGKLSLAEVLAPAIQMADGYPIEAQTANSIERNKERIRQWRYSRGVMLPHAGEAREAPRAGEIFRQPELAATLRKLVEAEQTALRQGRSRKEAIQAAYERFYRGDIAAELVRGTQEEGGLITLQDLDRWRVRIEEPVSTDYRGIQVYKLTHWTQGPAMLQALNILETLDLKGMGYNSARYTHALYQSMSMAFADRDFYYGDPAFAPVEPIRGLLSKEYARQRAATINWERNDPDIRPGDPYPFQGGTNPFTEQLRSWRTTGVVPRTGGSTSPAPAHDRRDTTTAMRRMTPTEAFYAGTTTVEAADAEGWVVSITPSGGWVPAVIAGRTGVGLSQRMQSFVVDSLEGPFNVVRPGKQPRVTLTPTMALRDGQAVPVLRRAGRRQPGPEPVAVLLNVVEFGMTVQQATEAANVNSFQMRASFGAHESQPGRLLCTRPPRPGCGASCGGWATRWCSRTAPPAPSRHLVRPEERDDVGRIK
jgi:gamma-glutamyltranspeptidase/glutathione hydrolase